VGKCTWFYSYYCPVAVRACGVAPVVMVSVYVCRSVSCDSSCVCVFAYRSVSLDSNDYLAYFHLALQMALLRQVCWVVRPKLTLNSLICNVLIVVLVSYVLIPCLKIKLPPLNSL